jgi:hypothetical protein
MKRIIALLSTGLVLCACAPLVPQIKECPGANGKDVTIRYGDSRIEVTYKVNVNQDEKVVLKLHPENNAASGVNYDDLEIELKGKTSQDDWIDRKLKSTDGPNKHIICVDGQAVGEYEYAVIVPGVGTIDPRIDVN